MSSDPNDHAQPSDSTESVTPSELGDAGPAPSFESNDSGGETPPADSTPEGDAGDREEPRPRRKILIGSQRDVAAYRPKPIGDSVRIVGVPRPKRSERGKRKADRDQDRAKAEPPARQKPVQPQTPVEAEPAKSPEVPPGNAPGAAPAPPVDEPLPAKAASPQAEAPQQAPVADRPAEQAPRETLPLPRKFPPPNVRSRLPSDLEEEFEQAMGGASVEDLIAADDHVTKQAMLEPDSQNTGRVAMIRREDVFVELGGREQGIVPLKQFDDPPEIGGEVTVRVVRFHADEGLYELIRPGAAADVGDWSDLEEGMVVETVVTGHNTGGLECEVNRIRGFIPVSQIALYRVEDLAQFVGEKFTCLVTEANPERRNLVLSRRAILEREKEEARRNLLESLAPGQIREGVVRKILEFGAFVDLGGVDGLLHVSQLAWGRVSHPSEVLQEGQTIQVKIQKIDEGGKRISLAYRDLQESPWTNVERKYPPNMPVHGKVTKLMEFGAFVELEPGVEGLIHISELAHRRVWRVSEVVNEGDEVDVLVLSVDGDAQRISLSMKGLIPEPKAAEKESPAEPDEPAPAPKAKRKPSQPLKGGLGRSPGGASFGLKW